jgi:cell division protein FtsB
MLKKYLPLFKNKYFLATSFLLVMLLFFEDTNVFRLIGYKIDHYKMVKENNRKEVEIQEIGKKTSELTTNIKTLEFFARETYRMKKTNEVIFLFVPKSEEMEE